MECKCVGVECVAKGEVDCEHVRYRLIYLEHCDEDDWKPMGAPYNDLRLSEATMLANALNTQFDTISFLTEPITATGWTVPDGCHNCKHIDRYTVMDVFTPCDKCVLEPFSMWEKEVK